MPVDLKSLTCSSRIGVPVSTSSARRGSLGWWVGGGGWWVGGLVVGVGGSVGWWWGGGG